MRFAALLLSAAVFQALLFAAETSTDLPAKLDVGDAHRSFLLHVPPNFDKTKSLPLLILLHGGQGHGKGIANLTLMNDKADMEGFVVAYPDGFWNSQFAPPSAANSNGKPADYELDDVAFISAMIDTLHTSRNIDLNRVYRRQDFRLTDFMAYRAAFELPDKIAAVGVVCGAIGIKSVNSVPALDKLPEPKGPISLIHIAGKKDQNVLFEGAQEVPLNKIAADSRLHRDFRQSRRLQTRNRTNPPTSNTPTTGTFTPAEKTAPKSPCTSSKSPATNGHTKGWDSRPTTRSGRSSRNIRSSARRDYIVPPASRLAKWFQKEVDGLESRRCSYSFFKSSKSSLTCFSRAQYCSASP